MVAQMTRKTYKVTATRQRRTGGWWAIEVPEIPGVFSQAKRLDGVTPMARDAIALMLDADPNSFDLFVEPRLDAAVDRLVREARELRSLVEAEQRLASQATRAAARALIARGLTVRDAGRLLGISHQRVAQLLSTPGRSKGESPIELSNLIDLMEALEASINAAKSARTGKAPARRASHQDARRSDELTPAKAG
jgi:predicted RNase H-like HicB family nuclease